MAHQLKIVLKYSEPKIYRTVIVPENFNFHQLHLVIQGCMSWENSHLYQFNLGQIYNSVAIKELFEDDDEFNYLESNYENLDSNDTNLSDIFNGDLKKINYVYDFGDDWVHIITVLKKPVIEVLYPRCIKGENAAPVEDCGGIGGFYNILEILEEKGNINEKKEWREWLDLEKNESYEDIYGFNLDKVNQDLMLEFS